MTEQEMKQRIEELEEAMDGLSAKNGTLNDVLKDMAVDHAAMEEALNDTSNPLDDMIRKMLDMYAEMIPAMIEFYRGYSFSFALKGLKVNPNSDVELGEIAFDVVAPKSEQSTEVSVD